MAKGNAIVMYLEQARIHGEPIGVTHSEVLFTKPNGYTVQPHNRVVSKADNKTMGESFLNELIYVLGAEDGEERKLPYDREVLVYTSDEINSDNYRTYINAVNTGINCPVHNFKLCQKLRRLCDERGYHLFFTKAVAEDEACHTVDFNITLTGFFLFFFQHLESISHRIKHWNRPNACISLRL